MATESDEASPATAPDRPPGAGTDDPPGIPVDDPTTIVEPPPRPTDPARRALLLAPIIAVLVGVVVVFATLPTGTPLPSMSGAGSASPGSGAQTGIPSGSTPSGSTPGGSAGSATGGGFTPGYLVSIDELRQKSERAAAGEEPYKTAVDDLMAWADRAADDRSRPEQPIYIKGTRDPFVTDARRAYGLGLAYVVSQDERYATAARTTIRAWMDVATSTRDTCPDRGACQTSLIIGRAGAGFALGGYLIAGSDAWTNADRVDLQAWMHDVIMPAASERPNNWGDAGAFLRIVAADYSGDQGEFDRAIETWRSFIDLIEADGRIPEEVRRGSAGISYTQEALQYKVAVAKIAERHGIDLWDYVGAQGGSLHKALDRLAYYWTRADEWPDYRNPLVPSPGPVWEIAYAHWQEPGWLDIVRESRPYGDEGHSAIRWTTLTNGVPFDPQVAAEPSAGMPSPGVPSPAPTVSPSAIVNNASTPVVDLQTSAFRPRVALFTKAWGRPGLHEIVVESLPRSGHATVAVDDIVTLTSTLREGS